MEIFGWIMLVLLGLAGLGAVILFAVPSVIESIKLMSYQMKKSAETKRLDVDAREEEKRKRDEIARAKDKELEDKKLELANAKTDKKIEKVNQKIEDVKSGKEPVEEEKKEEVKEPEVSEEVEQPKGNETYIPEGAVLLDNEEVKEPITLNVQ